MKNIITLFILLIAGIAYGQDIEPAGLKPITTASYKYSTVTLNPWLYMGKLYGITELATARNLKFKIDSLAGKSQMYQFIKTKLIVLQQADMQQITNLD